MEKILSFTPRLFQAVTPAQQDDLTAEPNSSAIIAFSLPGSPAAHSVPTDRDNAQALSEPARVLVIHNDSAVLETFQKSFAYDNDAVAGGGDVSLQLDAFAGDRRQSAFRVDLLLDGETACKRSMNTYRRGRPYAVAFVDAQMTHGWDSLKTVTELRRIDPYIQLVICVDDDGQSLEDLAICFGKSVRALILRRPFNKIDVLQMASALAEKWRLESERQTKSHDLEKRIEERTQHLQMALREREAYEVELQHQATHDMLTGLPNRVLLHERITQLVSHARQTVQGIAVLFIDLDRFKSINDSFGHSVGDALLTAVASRLRSAVRDSDVVARLSGDEFVVVLSGISEKEDVENVAKKVLGEISRPYEVEQQALCITGSIGVSIYPRDGDTSDMLLRNADAAMYCAKDQTGNVKFYNRELGAQVNEHMALESSLRQAVDHQEFEVYYQPQVDIKSGRINGVEALIRWRHPELGMISPDRFIPLAEETGLIVPIGEWVLRTACAQVKAWHVAGFSDLTVAVNFSAKQFQKNDLFDLVRRILDETKLGAEYLEIELTESLLMKDSDVTVQTLRQLKEMGAIMALDDFGTGYSSLSYLRRFPIDVVKIDCSFIRDVTNNVDDALLTKAIISMAKSLNLKTVAEGVETEGQLNFLKENQCDTIQGYYFSRPLPADDVTAMLFNKKHLPA